MTPGPFPVDLQAPDTTWFGKPTSQDYSQFSLIFSTLNGTSLTTYTYECVPTSRCAGLSDNEAFTTPSSIGHFFVCPAYYIAPATATESQAGILVHLGTHWKTVGDTGHWAIGEDDSKQLAVSNPDLAVLNADSYEFFAENSPPIA
ncbi:zincin [Auricularia subglabra TFB-10046 SS5]|nr:zincin [Auricularia subglabra TFB-10046 SS5]